MAESTTLTSKVQVSVPREIRKYLGPKAVDELTFAPLGYGTVIVRSRTKGLADLAGLLIRADQP